MIILKKPYQVIIFLLAEDNETNQQVIYELMKKVDIKVDIAKMGLQL